VKTFFLQKFMFVKLEIQTTRERERVLVVFEEEL